MKNIIRSGKDRTVMSVTPTSIILQLGSDLNDDKLKPFIGIIDELLDGMERPDAPFYGHFSFSPNRMEVTLSHKADSPNVGDLTYEYDW